MAKSFLNGRDSFGASSLGDTLKISSNFNAVSRDTGIGGGVGITNFKPAVLVRIGAQPVGDSDPDYSSLVLDKPESIIGRGGEEKCDHTIMSVEISRKHALIKYESNCWWILDLKSTNGLYLNGTRLSPHEAVPLKDGQVISFGPQNQCHFNYQFIERYPMNSQTTITEQSQCYSGPTVDRHDFVDPSGYESVATQDINLSTSPPNMMDLYRQLNFYREENKRLKCENTNFFAQLKDQSDHFRIISNDLKMQQRMLNDKETKLTKQNSNVKALMKKYRILLGQQEQQSKARCALSDDESNYSSSGLNSTTVSNVLKEITCSICSEYLVAPTSLNCSHVFCASCIDEWKREYRSKYNSASNGICPVCRKEVHCQTQVLAFENVINFFLDSLLSTSEKEDRSKMVETRRQKCASVSPSQQQPVSVNSILQQILSNLPRSRRSSIVITSDDDDDHEGDGDEDVVSVVSDHSNDGNNLGIRVYTEEDFFDHSDSSDDDGDFSRSISITLSGGNQNDHISVDLDLGNDSEDFDDEILMIEDESDAGSDESSNNSEDVIIGFYDIDDESHQDAIVISDSEDDQVVVPSRRPIGRRSSMIILSDSEDSLPAARRNSHQNGLNSSEIITISNDEAAPGGSNSLRCSNGGRSRSRRTHPYRRSGQNNNNNENNNSNNRRAALCM